MYARLRHEKDREYDGDAGRRTDVVPPLSAATVGIKFPRNVSGTSRQRGKMRRVAGRQPLPITSLIAAVA